MINIIEFLLNEAKTEMKLLEEYNAEVKRADNLASEQAKKDGKEYYSYWNYLKWGKPIPKKSIIKDNLKMIRRLSIQFEKELDKMR